MSSRLFAVTAAVLVAACAANPKSATSSTEVLDGAVASPAPPAPAPAPAATPGCASDADCGDGERCDSGRCTAASPRETCSLVLVRFAFDSALLDAAAMRLLRENADCLAKRRATGLLVEGHCDERGTTEYNIALGARRADAVKRYLAQLGVAAPIDSVSFGKELPAAAGADDAAWEQNRRAELRLPGEKRSDGKLVAGR